MPGPSFAAEITGIDNAIGVLEALKALLQTGTPTFTGFHDNPVAENCLLRRTNQVATDGLVPAAVTLIENPADTDPTTTVKSVLVEIQFE